MEFAQIRALTLDLDEIPLDQVATIVSTMLDI